jgi:hypothetical protein
MKGESEELAAYTDKTRKDEKSPDPTVEIDPGIPQ